MNPTWGNGMGGEPGNLPVGLAVLMAQNVLARDTYGRLTEQQKERIHLHMKGGLSGEEAMSRVLGTNLWDL